MQAAKRPYIYIGMYRVYADYIYMDSCNICLLLLFVCFYYENLMVMFSSFQLKFELIKLRREHYTVTISTFTDSTEKCPYKNGNNVVYLYYRHYDLPNIILF